MASKTYILRLGDSKIKFSRDSKNRHVSVCEDMNGYKETTKTWIFNGDVYKKVISESKDFRFFQYFKNDLYHRDGKPAYIYKDYRYRCQEIITEKWFQNGMLHNTEGPSYEYIEDYGDTIRDDFFYYKETRYFLNNLEYDDKINFDKEVSKRKRLVISKELYNNTNICKDVCKMISEYVV
jgi:hypothetical protein